MGKRSQRETADAIRFRELIPIVNLKGIPINSFSDRDAAWLEVVEGIEKVINDVLKQ